jgi:2-polyprenyl-3-methyl-5-hydroxy-6-metoxy-1,4-benzoquinol methylase
MTAMNSLATAPLRYSFHYADRCNMCGNPAAQHKVLGKRLNSRQGLWPKGKLGITTTVVRCKRCRLIYANPMPVPDAIEDHYGVPPEEYWHDHYFTLSEGYMGEQISQFASLHGKAANNGRLTALDVGAGIGKGMKALEAAGFDVYGIEPSEPFHSRAVGKMGIPAERLQNKALEDAVFDEDSFDFINMGAVVEHLYDPSAGIKRALKWLKPSGLIYVEVPSSAYLMNRLARLFYRTTGSDYVTHISPMHRPYHLYEFSLRSFQLHAEANAYQIAHYVYYVCESYMPRPLKPLFNLLMRVSRTGMQLAVWLKK